MKTRFAVTWNYDLNTFTLKPNVHHFYLTSFLFLNISFVYSITCYWDIAALCFNDCIVHYIFIKLFYAVNRRGETASK